MTAAVATARDVQGAINLIHHTMPHTYTIEEEVTERGMCQQEPTTSVGDMWYDNDHRLCVADDVRFIKYVWEDVALWSITVTAYSQDEITPELKQQYELYQKKIQDAYAKFHAEEEAKKQSWRKYSKWRTVNIGEGGDFIVEVYEDCGRVLLNRYQGECTRNASKIVIPEYITWVCDEAFRGCKSLKEVVFLTEKCSIDYHVFSDCKNLERVVLPAQSTFHADRVNCFEGCDKLSQIEINGDENNSWYYVQQSGDLTLLYAKKGCYPSHNSRIDKVTEDLLIFIANKSASILELPDTVKNISDFALFDIPNRMWSSSSNKVKTIAIRHDINVFCTLYANFLEESVFFYNHTSYVLSKDTKITLILIEIPSRRKVFVCTPDGEGGGKEQYGVRYADYKDRMPSYASNVASNDIRRLFLKNDKLEFED